jgi:hypothetical protein
MCRFLYAGSSVSSTRCNCTSFSRKACGGLLIVTFPAVSPSLKFYPCQDTTAVLTPSLDPHF